MAVTTETNFVAYAGDGVTDTFAITFPFLDASHIRVLVDGEVEAGFTVVGTDVVFTSPPDNGADIFIRRVVPIKQEKQYPTNDTFPAQSHEAALDQLTYIAQQQARDIDTAVKLPEDTTLTGLFLPAPEAGKAIKWNGDEDGFVNSTNDPDEMVEIATTQAAIATTQAGNAADSATASGAFAALAEGFATAAVAARDKAQDWADKAEDDPVETDPDQFSAKHWAAKAKSTAEGDAIDLNYDNTDSGLAADNVQDAIDEVVDAFGPLPLFVPVDWPWSTKPDNTVWMNGETIGNVGSNADIESADLDVLFEKIKAEGAAYGNTGSEVWANGDTVKLPDFCGRVRAGKDDMGGISSKNRLTDQSGGVDGDVLGDTGGAETHTLTTPQIPSHNHNNGVADDGGNHPFVYGTTSSGIPGSANNGVGLSGSPSIQGLTSSTGGGGAHNNVQPTIIQNVIMRYV